MIIKIQNDSASTPDPVRMISVAVIVVLFIDGYLF